MYPQHHYGSGRPPYPPSHGAPYPPAPTAQSVYPPSLGFSVDAPIYMPTPGYPPSSSGPYPPVSNARYPSGSPAHYPSGSSAPYPSSGSSIPYGSGSPTPYPAASSIPYPSGPSSVSYPSASPVSYPSSGTSAHYPSVTNVQRLHTFSSYSSASSGSAYPTASSHAKPSSPYPRDPHKTTYHTSSASYPNTQYSQNPTLTNALSSSHYGTGPTVYKGTPTVVPASPFNARDDAEILRRAMKGFGTDEKAIINVLSRRTNAQRLQIAVEFKTMYGKDLVKDLKSETSGKFEDLLVALMTPLPQFYAKELHDAIVGIGTEESVLIEVLCTKSNNEIRTIRQAYHSMYNKCLEDDLRGDTSGTFKRLMVSLCNACRDESMVTNPAQAAEDARQLLKAGELRYGTDESTFNMVLCQRNYAQLRLIFEEYYRITGHDFEQAVKNEFSGNSKDGLLAIVRSIRNLPGFFAKCLQNAIAGLGTNDKTLIRVVTTRCEIDMGNIKQNYLAQYGETLADAIKGDTSGDYKKLLLALIGES